MTLEPVLHQPAELVVEAPDGTVTTYTPETLEALPTFRVTTKTPWRLEPADFDGVLLADLLKKHGLDQLPAVIVTAENDFMVEMPKETWEAAPFLIATRANGVPLTRRNRGPILFVVDAEDYERETVIRERHLVWMVNRIHAP
ncbi:hypothetical protein GCM10011316_12630 [Roseibium aquae]|uniref:Oxidoreductase molybdopterin-binding domain-containing protein n=1 Tax=Roseibium aquae TaxID=1323746 RepID=A0A916WZ75_9HYPH|nr:hypothetical protein GCM10011316_12630 [Roseibium aquae]